MLDILKSSVQIGLEKPVKLLHVTDTHLCDMDDRDDFRKYWVVRRDDRAGNRRMFQAAIDYCNENCDLMVHTGDLISLVSKRSMEVVREHLATCKDYFAIAGNHEFSNYGGEAWEDIAYRMTNYQRVRQGLGFDLLFASRQIGGVNLVALDNGYYHVEEWQRWRLEQEIKKGLPIVLMMHVPFFEQGLYDRVMSQSHDHIGYVMGCDEEHLLPYSEDRAVQQRPTPDTLRFIDYVYSQPLIKCVLAGHVHLNYESKLASGIVQFVTGHNYGGFAREITLY
jgi:3',5'-cyclic AMP phosphodiesterase CpdA